MFLVYIDESGNTGLNFKDNQQPVFLLSALIIHSSQWFQAEKDFHFILDKYLGDNTGDDFELHAIALKTGSGIFKTLPLEKRILFRNEILELIHSYKFHLIYRRIIKKAYENFCIEQYGTGIKVDPYIMALPFVCMEVNDYLKKQKGALGMLIFDEQKQYLSDIERSLKLLRLSSDSILKTTHLIEKGFFVNSKHSFAIQLVDMASYYVRKYEESKSGFKVSDIDKQTFPLIEKIIIPGDNSYTKDIFEWIRKNHI